MGTPCIFASVFYISFLFFCNQQVIADAIADPSFVAADLLSQAEHGTDSQVVLVAVNLSDNQLAMIQVTDYIFIFT